MHKAQGSQFRRVAVVVTPSRILDHALIYTALTRGIEQVVFLGDRTAFEAAIAAPALAPPAGCRFFHLTNGAQTDLRERAPPKQRLGVLTQRRSKNSIHVNDSFVGILFEQEGRMSVLQSNAGTQTVLVVRLFIVNKWMTSVDKLTEGSEPLFWKQAKLLTVV